MPPFPPAIFPDSFMVQRVSKAAHISTATVGVTRFFCNDVVV